MDLRAGTVVADRFRLERKLGEGGMGEVWHAHHVQLDSPCAVKFIHAEIAKEPGVAERFEREAKAAAQIRSPNVVHVLDYGVWHGMPYIAMEYLDGEDLGARLKARGRLSPAETVSIVTQVARALGKAHAAGLIHRDLKPENVFLVRDDDGEIAKVLDFGIAKSQNPLKDHNTRTGAMLGTPRFMSPEQAQGVKTIDHRSDLWSLGIITYRCIVGYLPFDSDALGDLLMRIMVHPMPVPSMILPGVPTSFDAWWARAAARDPANRFQSAKELAEALATALGMSPISLGGGAVPWTPGGPTPPAVSAHSPVPLTDPRSSAQAVGAATPQPVYPSAPPPVFVPAPVATMPGPPPQYAAIPERTMSPATRTFASEGSTRRSVAPIVIALGVLGVLVIGVVTVVAVAARFASTSDPAPASTGPTVVVTVPPPRAGPPPDPPADPAAANPMVPTGVAVPQVPRLPVKAQPKPPPAPAPAPAVPAAPTRTGKVTIAPPPAMNP